MYRYTQQSTLSCLADEGSILPVSTSVLVSVYVACARRSSGVEHILCTVCSCVVSNVLPNHQNGCWEIMSDNKHSVSETSSKRSITKTDNGRSPTCTDTFWYILEVLVPGHLDTGVQCTGLVGGTGRDHISCGSLQHITT